jgi:two-component system, chemotaxis family, protein-glutamate methylesterase/glutaminase
MRKKPIKILIVDDSKVIAEVLKVIFESEDDFQVLGHASNGQEAVEMSKALKPDIITMDIRMPVMDGFEATRKIMVENPTPIVVVSASVDDEELRITFKAIEAGALTVIEKPQNIGSPDFSKISVQLIDTIRALSEIKVVRRKRSKTIAVPEKTEISTPASSTEIKVVGIGCSTGGLAYCNKFLANFLLIFPHPFLSFNTLRIILLVALLNG